MAAVMAIFMALLLGQHKVRFLLLFLEHNIIMQNPKEEPS